MGIVLTDIDLVNMNTAISTNFLLWALLMFSCPDPGWTTQAQEMASLEVKMTNIMDRMTRMEAEMVAKDDRIAVLEAAMETLEASIETKDQRIAVLEDTVEMLEKAVITKDIQMCELEEDMKSLPGRITVTEETDVLLRGMVDQVRNPPFAFQCAYKYEWTTNNSVITFDRLTFDEISGGDGGDDGGLDINTGVFTVGQGYSGVWEVTYTIRSWQFSGQTNQASLYINGEQIEESYHQTYYGGSDGWVGSVGSRSLYMRLESGDTISLRTGVFAHYLGEITLCFELAQLDSVPPM